mmetsp:Transcript_33589/g.51681  ORF Transcript_33589/g.51681 Transcript_33589/m.51681 type:complete len:138 (-) Transcript_33589:1943-2356(-)
MTIRQRNSTTMKENEIQQMLEQELKREKKMKNFLKTQVNSHHDHARSPEGQFPIHFPKLPHVPSNFQQPTGLESPGMNRVNSGSKAEDLNFTLKKNDTSHYLSYVDKSIREPKRVTKKLFSDMEIPGTLSKSKAKDE